MRRKRKLFAVLAVIALLPACSHGFHGKVGRVGYDSNHYADIAGWVCRQMEVRQGETPLPKLVIMQEKVFHLELGRLKHLGVHISSVQAVYLPGSNQMWVMEGSEDSFIAHELVHWVQFKIQRRLSEDANPEDPQVRRTIFALELEAERFQKLFKRHH